MPDRTRIDLALRGGAGRTEVARLGGATLYSTSDRAFRESFASYMATLDEELRSRLLLSRADVFRAVGARLWPVLERKLHSALVGSFLRVGRGDAIGCMSVNRRLYSVLIHESRIAELRAVVGAVLDEIRNEDTVGFRRILQLAPGVERHDVVHVMAHLAYLGQADYHERWSIGRPAFHA